MRCSRSARRIDSARHVDTIVDPGDLRISIDYYRYTMLFTISPQPSVPEAAHDDVLQSRWRCKHNVPVTRVEDEHASSSLRRSHCQRFVTGSAWSVNVAGNCPK
jgi:hypothetical protein